MRAYLINPPLERCGVHQYGTRMFDLLRPSTKIEFLYVSTGNLPLIIEPDAVLYNWHPLIDPGCSVLRTLPPELSHCKKVIFYHDGEVYDELVDAILFSNCATIADCSLKWHYIGRPLSLHVSKAAPPSAGELVIGLHGLIGAWAATMTTHVLDAYQTNVKIRMLLPPSDYCDPAATSAASALAMARAQLPHGVTLEASHEFLSEPELLDWLASNHANCYVRNQFPSNGISSVLDLALSAKRPIIINRHPMFRHLHDCKPSICLEDTKMPDIIANGLSPLVPHYQRNDPAVVRAEVENVLLGL